MNDSEIRILLVEDNPADAALLQDALRVSRFGRATFTCVIRVAEAILLLANSQFDIVLVDLSLPDCQGLATLEQIRKHCYALPVIVMTGLDDEDVARQALQRGAQDYLIKGEMNGDSIARAVRYAIERKVGIVSAKVRETELAHLSRLALAGQLASGLAHEMNQPLGAILNYAFGTLNMATQPDVKVEQLVPALSAMAEEAKRAGEIVRSLRAMVNKRPVERAPADINGLVNQSIHLLACDLRNSGIRVCTSLSPNLPKIDCAGVQIVQVIVNLIRNALDAMKSEGAVGTTLFISTSMTDNYVRIEVTDQGCGISEKDISRVFDAFYSTKADGMGLGLSICRAIIDDSGGELAVDSLISRGTTFSFTLPIESSARKVGINGLSAG